MTDRYLTKAELLSIPETDLPLLVLSDNPYSFFAWGIRVHEKGYYNHLMWMHKPGILASQDGIFREAPLKKYLGHRLKFWTNETWTALQKAAIKETIQIDLNRFWLWRLYDPVAIIGQWTGCESIQIPGLDICSDKGKYIKKADRIFDLKRPSPKDVNSWLEEAEQYLRGYRVWARYVPD